MVNSDLCVYTANVSSLTLVYVIWRSRYHFALSLSSGELPVKEETRAERSQETTVSICHMSTVNTWTRVIEDDCDKLIAHYMIH